MSTSYSFIDTQTALIKPFDRFKFVIVFILMTSLGYLAATHLIYSQASFDLLRERNYAQYSVAFGAILGTFWGVTQWLVLRRYIPGWKWILVVGLSTTVTFSIQAVFDMWKDSLVSSPDRLAIQGTPIVLLLVVSLATSIGSSFLSGYLQWFVISPHVKKARWWILITLFATLVFGALSILVVSTPSWLPFNRNVFKATILPATQAIGFCLLKKKSVNILQSPLALAPDIVDYWDIKRLQKILYMNINRLWKGDLSMSAGQLTYLVGVSRSGAVVTYEPMDPTSTDNVDQTPLPELAIAPHEEPMEAETLTAFAKFQIVFMPPGILQIDAWRGIPLTWIGLAVGVGIVGVSILSAWLQIDLLPSGV
jgi:hypothetical protein